MHYCWKRIRCVKRLAKTLFFALVQIAYLISTIPFAVSVMMLVRCTTLPGAISGLQYLFVPDMKGTFLTNLISPKVRIQVTAQHLFCMKH